MTIVGNSLLIGICAGTLGAWVSAGKMPASGTFAPALLCHLKHVGGPATYAKRLLAGCQPPAGDLYRDRAPSPVNGVLWAIISGGALLLGYDAQLKRNRLAQMRSEWPVFLEEHVGWRHISGMDITSAFLTPPQNKRTTPRELSAARGRVTGGCNSAKPSRFWPRMACRARALAELCFSVTVLGTRCLRCCRLPWPLEAATVETSRRLRSV